MVSKNNLNKSVVVKIYVLKYENHLVPAVTSVFAANFASAFTAAFKAAFKAALAFTTAFATAFTATFSAAAQNGDKKCKKQWT